MLLFALFVDISVEKLHIVRRLFRKSVLTVFKKQLSHLENMKTRPLIRRLSFFIQSFNFFFLCKSNKSADAFKKSSCKQRPFETNYGNFLDEFRARDVPEFKQHLERSINYTSHDIQNELIQLFAKQIVQRKLWI